MFERYIKSLDNLNTPIDLTSALTTDGEVFEYGEFKKYKTIWSDRPFGKLFQIDDKTLTVDLQIGSSYAPVLIVYDRVGHKLDSLYPYKKTESDIDFEISENVHIDSDKRIIVTCVTEKWELANGEKRIETSKTTTMDTVTYAIDDKGKFRELRK